MEECSAWSVQLAQFVPPLSDSNLGFFIEGKGAWIVSRSAVTLTVYKSPPTIAVVLNGNIHEEHYIPLLSFARARTSGGSSIILASFTKSGTTHKFAMRFFNGCDAEACFRLLQDIMNSEESYNLRRSLNRNRFSLCLSTAPLEGTYSESMRTVEQPPTKDVNEEAMQLCFHSAAEDANTDPVSSTSTSLREQIIRCLLDPSFPEFVKEVEEAWHELEGDTMQYLNKLRL